MTVKKMIPLILDSAERYSKSLLAVIGLAGCVAIYADFRCVVDRQLQGYEQVAGTITALTAEIKDTREAVRENSIRLEHLEREHEAIRTENK